MIENFRFVEEIEKKIGQRIEIRGRGRPHKNDGRGDAIKKYSVHFFKGNNMKSLKTIVFLILCCVSTTALAEYEGGQFKVTSLRMAGDGVYIQFSPAPSACNGGDQYRMHARVQHSVSGNYNTMVSTLLTAYTTGQTFKFIWYSALPAGFTSCGNNEILELIMVEFSNK